VFLSDKSRTSVHVRWVKSFVNASTSGFGDNFQNPVIPLQKLRISPLSRVSNNKIKWNIIDKEKNSDLTKTIQQQNCDTLYSGVCVCVCVWVSVCCTSWLTLWCSRGYIFLCLMENLLLQFYPHWFFFLPYKSLVINSFLQIRAHICVFCLFLKNGEMTKHPFLTLYIKEKIN
jgi:hypothetical protein